VTPKKRESFYESITPNQKMSFPEYVGAISTGNIVSVRSYNRRKPGMQSKTVPVRRYEKRKRKH